MKVVTIPLKFVAVYALVKDGKAVLIDTGMPGSEEQIIQAFKSEAIGVSDVKLIIVTHAHADHTGSVERLRGISGAPVGIHKKDSPFVQSGTSAPVVPATLIGRFMAVFSAKMNEKMNVRFDPDVLFEGTVSLADYGFPARVIPTPGHTPGSVSVITEDGDAIIGDIVARQFMMCGKASFPIFATEEAQVIASLKAILAENPRRCLSSHAGEVKVKEIERLVQRYKG